MTREHAVAALLAAIDAYDAARARVIATPNDDQPAMRGALDDHARTWRDVMQNCDVVRSARR